MRTTHGRLIFLNPKPTHTPITYITRARAYRSSLAVRRREVWHGSVFAAAPLRARAASSARGTPRFRSRRRARERAGSHVLHHQQPRRLETTAAGAERRRHLGRDAPERRGEVPRRTALRPRPRAPSPDRAVGTYPGTDTKSSGTRNASADFCHSLSSKRFGSASSEFLCEKLASSSTRNSSRATGPRPKPKRLRPSSSPPFCRVAFVLADAPSSPSRVFFQKPRSVHEEAVLDVPPPAERV